MTHEAPLPDYDELTTSAIQSQIRTLDAEALDQLLAYERAHADRPLVVQTIEHRLDALHSGESPSGGDPTGAAPGAGESVDVPRQTDGHTDAPPVNPPSHGDPTNPAQPRD
ncbi:hypothetical protein D9V41_10625 [Aeromicrobium phragmitis]|uniref:DUF8129 domain-containing protein n=1 Tax=Aeromicrobium phragmitis TaxID=2478914 RepID=A0A3L8PJG6_9ACTN|nr:hypothetical protein [Aeromicrobium phragmitis]RLV55536.1 hypothetical protein D9V41_10625 [Aeromicrobium phragmitis]